MSSLFAYDRWERLQRSAVISDCGLYRYHLRRTYEHGGDGRVVAFVMLNPSSADALSDDPTIRRCLGFVRALGCSTLSVVNLFAWRATDPAELSGAADPVGPLNAAHLRAALTADLVVAAWGASVPPKLACSARHQQALLGGAPLWCLGRTKSGAPRHPLYVRADQELVPYQEP